MAELTRARYKVGGMDCASCAAKIDTAVRRMPGVAEVSVSVSAGTMTVEHDDTSDLGAIEKKVSGLGYSLRALGQKPAAASPAHPHSADHAHQHGPNCNHDHHDHSSEHEHAGAHDHHHHGDASKEAAIEGLHGHDHGPMDGPWWKSKKGRLTIFTGAGLIIAYALGHLVPAFEIYAFAIAMLVGLVPIARRAIMAALAGTPFSIEMLMTIAAIGALVIGATEEAATVVFLFLVGELLEGVAAGRARASIAGLSALVPKTALLVENGKTREVPAETLQIGSTILVRPGDRISADGTIISGTSASTRHPSPVKAPLFRKLSKIPSSPAPSTAMRP